MFISHNPRAHWASYKWVFRVIKLCLRILVHLKDTMVDSRKTDRVYEISCQSCSLTLGVKGEHVEVG